FLPWARTSTARMPEPGRSNSSSAACRPSVTAIDRVLYFSGRASSTMPTGPARLTTIGAASVITSSSARGSALDLDAFALAVPQPGAVRLRFLLQLVLLDLLARGLRQLVDEVDEARDHEVAHVLGGELHDLGVRQRRARLP